MLKTALMEICHLIISKTEGKNIDWLPVLPLFHFLALKHEPFMELPKKHKNIKWGFWDVLTKNKKGFQECVHQSKYSR